MLEQQKNEKTCLFATIGSRAQRNGRVTKVTSKAEYRGMALARVGDIVTYDDGSEAIIICSTDGVAYSVSFATVGVAYQSVHGTIGAATAYMPGPRLRERPSLFEQVRVAAPNRTSKSHSKPANGLPLAGFLLRVTKAHLS